MNKSTSEVADLTVANQIFTRTFARSVKGFGLVFSFRHIANVGLGLSLNELRDSWMLLMHQLETDPDYAGILIPLDPNAPPRSTDWSAVADAATQSQARQFFLAVDAASLVFAHSVLDDAALQYCRVTAAASQSAWERFVVDKKIVLADAREVTYEHLLHQKIDDYIKKLGKESLMVKIHKLFAICQPDTHFKPIRGFSYDQDQLKALDQLRHDIIHGSGPVQELPNGDDDIRFMQSWGNYLMMLVHNRFGVQIDANEAVGFMGDRQPAQGQPS